MNRFESAIVHALAHEGGYVNDPDDPGGATKFGISLRWLKKVGDLSGDFDMDGDIDVDDIKAMTNEQARELYRVHWWVKYGYEKINSQDIATKVLDLSINMGAKQAHILLQRACRACGFELLEDGIIGPVTLTTINNIQGFKLLPAFRSEAAGFYRILIAQKPVFKKYQTGWLKRAYA